MTGIIIQARMGSSRLPGKILMQMEDKTLLGHILFRLQRLKSEAKVIIVTSTLPQDDIVESFCNDNSVACYRGDEKNVLSRYYYCSLHYKFDNIARLTGDNPFIDIDELDNLISMHINSKNDFSESFSSLPIGIGSEIFSFSALEKSMALSTQPHHFEHVDEYILENRSDFRFETLSVPQHKGFPDLRLTVDTNEDFDKALYILKHSKNQYVTTEEAIALCMQYA